MFLKLNFLGCPNYLFIPIYNVWILNFMTRIFLVLMAFKLQIVFTEIFFIEFLPTSTGPVMTKFTIALREIGTYKEVLRSQVKNFDLLFSELVILFFFWLLYPNGFFLNQASLAMTAIVRL